MSTWEPTSTGTKPVKFAVPALPQRVTAVSDAGPPGAVATATASNLNAPPKKPIGPPKTAFPDAHLPYLLTTITDLKAPGLNFLVDSVFQELKVHKVKKNAIEAKIREIAEKCKSTRVWIVKDDVSLHLYIVSRVLKILIDYPATYSCIITPGHASYIPLSIQSSEMSSFLLIYNYDT